MSITIASLCGILLNDKKIQNGKIQYYQKLSKKFEQEKNLDQNWYLPKWEDNAIWQKQHKRHWNYGGNASYEQYEREKFRIKYPTPESFRDYCFEKVRTEMSSCNNSNNWCMECTRDKDWDKK